MFVIDNMNLGGTELNAVRTAELLDRSRYDLRLVCLSGAGPLTPRYRAMGVPIVEVDLRSLYGVSMLTAGRAFARYLRSEGIDVVHAHDMYSNVFAAVWGRVAGVPVVIASRRWWHSLPSRPHRWATVAAFRLAKAVLANSAQVARSVHEADGIRRDKIWTISNFADESAFAPLTYDALAAQRLEWNVSPGATVIGCVARLAPVKDHATLLSAFAMIRTRRSGVHLVIVGDGASRAALERQARELGISDAVTFAGELRTGANHHRHFDVSVLASRSEGFPNTLVEAMAAGVPVVATAVGGNLDAVEDGVTGLLVPPANAEALATALTRLVDDAHLRSAMGVAGSERAMTRYRASQAIQALQGMYDTLLAEVAA